MKPIFFRQPADAEPQLLHVPAEQPVSQRNLAETKHEHIRIRKSGPGLEPRDETVAGSRTHHADHSTFYANQNRSPNYTSFRT